MKFTKTHREFLLKQLNEANSEMETQFKSKKHFEDNQQQEIAELCEIDIFLLEYRIELLNKMLIDNTL
tara:strand:- start:486 stop:689 length:204 start_codon:yes stop_codon:yes gene_type:complete